MSEEKCGRTPHQNEASGRNSANIRCIGKDTNMENSARNAVTLLIGIAIGVGVGLLFAPQSGEETREWLTAEADQKRRRLQRKGRRWIHNAQDVLDRGEGTVSKFLRSGKNALGTVAAKLD